MVAISITDPRERELPAVGFIELEDAETGEIILIDTGDRSVRDEFKAVQADDAAQRRELFRSIGVDYIDIMTNESLIDPLLRFFLLREKRP